MDNAALDGQMVYSCAYFATREEDLDSAQERKLDYLCRKLRPGERLLDIGCGWGGLIIHAAHRYGVRALGITLSEPQAELANERIRRAGLAESSPTFVGRYVFPDGELVPIGTTLGAAEGRGFEVRDVESLREHYALTLGHWVRRLEARADEARRITDETTYRVWRLYMFGSAHGESGLPLTRADWYA